MSKDKIIKVWFARDKNNTPFSTEYIKIFFKKPTKYYMHGNSTIVYEDTNTDISFNFVPIHNVGMHYIKEGNVHVGQMIISTMPES